MKAWMFLVVTLVALAAPDASAGKSAGHPAKATAKAEANKAKKPKKQRSSPSAVVFVAGSEETVGQRSARLSRECKGRPNSGACAGYAN
jgi:hypothetical protein